MGGNGRSVKAVAAFVILMALIVGASVLLQSGGNDPDIVPQVVVSVPTGGNETSHPTASRDSAKQRRRAVRRSSRGSKAYTPAPSPLDRPVSKY